jgi:hypothetical protein
MSLSTTQADDDDRVVQLVSSAFDLVDDGTAMVGVVAETEGPPGSAEFALTEDDAWEMADALRHAAEHVSGRHPQALIRMSIYFEDS